MFPKGLILYLMLDINKNSFEYNNMDQYFELILRCEKPIPSTNKLYGVKTSSEFYLLPEVTEFLNLLKDQLVLTDPVSHCPWINTLNSYSLTFNFILNHSFWKRDLDNLIKKTQDVLFECISVNDRSVIELHTFKSYYEKSEYEYIILRLGVSHFNWNYFNE